MITIDIEVIMLGIFLTVNLLLGLYHARNIKTMEDYALGGRNFSTSALVSTIIATWIGGDYLFITIAEVYKTGLHYTIGCLGMVVCLFLNAYIFVPRMKEFLGNLSVAEAMGNLYGKQARIISAISGTIASAGFIAVQFKVFGEILKTFVGLSGNIPIIASAVIVIIYSTFGGIRSVAFTDIIQFFTFGVLIPVLGFIVWNDFNNTPGISITNAVKAPIFDYENFLGLQNPNFWSLVLLLILFSLPDINPTMFQRVAMGRNIRQVKKAFTISSVILLLILLGMAWIGFLLYSINPNLDPNNLVQYIINEYSHPWLRSFILIGVISMCMSTADSNINSSSVLLTHDLLGPLNIRLKNELSLSRLISVLLGISSIFLALLDYDLLPLVFMTQSFYIPIIDVPLILAIIGFRTSAKSVFIGMLAGLIGVIIWRIFFMDMTNVDSILPGMIVNFVFLLGSHYLLKQPGGWIDNKSISEPSKGKNSVSSLIQKLKNFRILDFLRLNTPKNELSYTALGIFCLISTFCSMYTMDVLVYKDVIINLYESMLFISICFLTYPIWPQILKRDIVSTYGWYFGVLYLLVFCNTFILLLNEFGHVQLTIFLLSMIVITMITKWRIAVVLIGVGIYFATKFYKSYAHVNTFESVIGYNQFLLYSFLLIGTVVIVFFRPQKKSEELAEFARNYLNDENKKKQLELIKLSKHREEFIARLDQECIEVFRSIHKQIYDLINKLGNKAQYQSLENIEAREKTLIQIAEKLKIGSDYLNNIISSVQNKIKLNLIESNLQDFIENSISEYNMLYLSNSDITVIFNNKAMHALFDSRLIKNVFFEILNFVNKFLSHPNICIVLEDSQLEYDVDVESPFKIRRPAIKFAININLKLKKQELELEQFINLGSREVDSIYLIDTKKVISAHYGKIQVFEDNDNFVFEIIIPTNLKDIRPKKMDLIDEQIATIEEINNLITEKNKEVLYKIAVELIKEDLDFLVISKITKLNLETIQELSNYLEGNT